jgi:hypothetical protein
MTQDLTRRTFLRGLLGGASISLGLPALEIFLNDHGNAWANGAPLPLRFGTWFWGCGMNPSRWVPTQAGDGWEPTVELAPVNVVREHVNILSGFNAILDGRLNHPHQSGVIAMLTGEAPEEPHDVPAPTLDILISDAVGNDTRFRSIEMSASGSARHSYSRRSKSNINPAEVSPVALYTRIFGPDFRDPNAAEFVPDPAVMLRRSVVSAVKDDRTRLEARLGAADRRRLDEYLTSVRQLERQLEVQLSEPPPLAACSVPPVPKEMEVGSEINSASRNHELMTDVLALALACDQTRVFNMVFSYGASNLHKEGNNTGHHQLTHEEPMDPEQGCQPRATFFVDRSMEAWATFVQKLAAIEEGDGTLLDNTFVLAHSETSFAKVHDVLGLPVMTAGRAGGRVKTGQHIEGAADPVTRIGLSAQQIMGLGRERWGSQSMETSRAIGELFA